MLKCEAPTGVCQACYGRSMATGNLAQIGDAVGIIAAQSIGEPGTQLTMRTFHTGGIAGADITHGLPRVVELFEARKPKGLAKIAEVGGTVTIEETDKALTVVITDDGGDEHRHTFPRRTRLFVENGEKIEPGKQLNEGSVYPHELLAIRGRTETELYLVKEVQEVYKSQGVDINDKHIELIVRQMLKKVRVDQKGDTDLLPGVFVDRHEYAKINQVVIDAGGEPAQAEEIILGITKASLNTDSFLSAASFQETTKVLTDAALEGKIDRLNGLKENVIIGKLIPAATGLKRYRRIEIEPAEPLPRGIDDVGLLDHDELAAELGLDRRRGPAGLRPRARGRPRRPRGDRRRQRRLARVRRGARRARRPGRSRTDAQATATAWRRSRRVAASPSAGGLAQRHSSLTWAASMPDRRLGRARAALRAARLAAARTPTPRTARRARRRSTRAAGAARRRRSRRASSAPDVRAPARRCRSNDRCGPRPASPSAWGRYSFAFSSQPVHHTARTRRRADEGVRRRWPKGSGRCRRPSRSAPPAARAAAKPNSEITPSTSTSRSGRVGHRHRTVSRDPSRDGVAGGRDPLRPAIRTGTLS